jgi:multidrug efflux pump subunit AcrA (membrane-fusion protein)
VPVDLVDVVRAPLSVTIDADGQTRIRNLYEVASPIAGTARRAPVAVGDSVVSGQTVVAMVEPVSPALLDARSRAQAEASVAEAEAALDVARSDLRRAEEEEAFARLQFDRTQTLMTRGVATVTQMETVAQGLAVAEAAVAAAQSRVAMSEGSLERAQATLARPEGDAASAEDCCVILRAPSDGVVLSIATISEHPVQAGAPLLSVGDPTDLEIVADLLSSDAVRIGPGTRAIVERWGGPDPLEATLSHIEPAAETRVSALGIEEQRVDAIFAIETPAGGPPGPRPRLCGLPAHRRMGKRNGAAGAAGRAFPAQRRLGGLRRGGRRRAGAHRHDRPARRAACGGAGGSGGRREDRHPPQRRGGRRGHDRRPHDALTGRFSRRRGEMRFPARPRPPACECSEGRV